MEQFHVHFHRLYRYLDRLSGDPDLAADLAQEAFVKLYRRGALPVAPAAWLITVGLNLLRNARSTRSRRRRLLTPERGERVLADPPPSPD
ncbi:MAG: sigma factor, partial [Gemmatimonadales bacterium]